MENTHWTSRISLRQNFGQGHNIAALGRGQKQVKLQPSLNGEQPAVILLRQSFDQDLAGNYQYSYQLSNGQQVEEAGRIQPGTQPETGTIDQLGHFEYVSDDGNTYRVDYLANEGGFQPQAVHLPVAPAQIPEYAQLRQEHPELFWAEEGGAGANQQKFGKDGGQFFF
ncbi:Larval cuticle protein 65Ag2 [Amphibalanus amphitrite]|uniref:Larval cuticle protein 65Ag2 n=1 Tax=Amphibalanus amphitrite TaxID=1232801 RepID=A0A6A4X0G2_AMPAM|nr:Larval cuticle protein 65Ag2 [Amphibalanus amphitrite]